MRASADAATPLPYEDRGMTRPRLLAGATGIAALVAAGLIAALAFTAGGGSKATTTAGATPRGASRVAALLHGIPQHGTTLGYASAPVTLVEFADPQCPFCADWAAESLPAIVRDYVRPGKVRLLFNGMSFVGPDSETALRTALAAGRQNRFWNVLDLLYANQGTENTGWVTDSLLRSVGSAVRGLDVQRMLDDRDSAAVQQGLAEAASLAQQAGVNSTPTFAVGRTGGTLQILRLSSLEPSALTPALDAALGS